MKKMKFAFASVIVSFVAFVGCETIRETKPLRVLMIGNSFSISCMRHMPKVAKSLGLKLDLTSMYIGGCSLQRHAGNIANKSEGFRPYKIDRNCCGKDWFKECAGKAQCDDGFENGPRNNIPQMLKSCDWDVVTIQQASGYSWRPESYHPYGDVVVKTIRELAPGAEIVVQKTWSYAVGEKRLEKWGFDQNEMFARLDRTYTDFAAGYGFRMIPMGDAVQEWRKRLPVKDASSDVIGKDLYHLSPAGEYFQALLWTAFLFDVDVTLCDYRPKSVKPDEAALMKRIVMDVVKRRK